MCFRRTRNRQPARSSQNPSRSKTRPRRLIVRSSTGRASRAPAIPCSAWRVGVFRRTVSSSYFFSVFLTFVQGSWTTSLFAVVPFFILRFRSTAGNRKACGQAEGGEGNGKLVVCVFPEFSPFCHFPATRTSDERVQVRLPMCPNVETFDFFMCRIESPRCFFFYPTVTQDHGDMEPAEILANSEFSGASGWIRIIECSAV